jgi:menaquinone-dependent protoporphyrinogen oxidase
MRVLVVYSSQYGSTKGIAERIAETLRGQDTKVVLASADAETAGNDLDIFDGFVIGSAIHAGHWLKPAVEFVHRYDTELGSRPTWLFSSGPIGEKYVHEPQPDPKEIESIRHLLNVKDHVVFAGAFLPETIDESRSNWIERTIAKRFIPAGDFRDWPAIEGWADRIAEELSPVPVTA